MPTRRRILSALACLPALGWLANRAAAPPREDSEPALPAIPQIFPADRPMFTMMSGPVTFTLPPASRCPPAGFLLISPDPHARIVAPGYDVTPMHCSFTGKRTGFRAIPRV